MNKVDYITVGYGICGYYAIYMKWYDDIKDFDIYLTGVGKYDNFNQAVKEAKEWAMAEGIKYIGDNK